MQQLILTFWQKKGTIIGILRDFHFNSLHEPIKPLIIRYGENEKWGWALVRTEAGKTRQALIGLEQLWRQLNPRFLFSYQFSDEEFQLLCFFRNLYLLSGTSWPGYVHG